MDLFVQLLREEYSDKIKEINSKHSDKKNVKVSDIESKSENERKKIANSIANMESNRLQELIKLSREYKHLKRKIMLSLVKDNVKEDVMRFINL